MWENSENGGLFLVVALFSDYHSFGYLSIVGDGFHHNEMNYILHRACTVQGPVALAHIVNHLDHAVELDFGDAVPDVQQVGPVPRHDRGGAGLPGRRRGRHKKCQS